MALAYRGPAFFRLILALPVLMLGYLTWSGRLFPYWQTFMGADSSTDAETSLVFECTTGWTRVEPGTNKETDAVGYIQIEQSGRRMALYHVWGEI